MQLLREEINARNLPLGVTETGRDWCIKALHPADPLTEVRGIPDHSSVPSLLMNYQSTFTLEPAAGAVGDWEFDCSLLPHPISFISTAVTDSTGTVYDEKLNQQLAGVTHEDKFDGFTDLAQRWRLAYMSVTCYQDGPDLANQGTLVVAQVPVEPRIYFPTREVALTALLMGSKCAYFTAEDKPSFNTSQSMPNAYFNRSRDGAYVPLKLTDTCQHWSSMADAIAPLHPTAATRYSVLMPTGPSHDWPFWTMDTASSAAAPVDSMNTYCTSPLLNATVAHISARNLAVTTKFTFYVRCGIEMQVSPSSALAPQLKLSPPYDNVALDSYFMLARELKDAFPANYNDLGKIWDAINVAASAVLPYLKQLGPYGQAAAKMGRGVLMVGNTIQTRRQQKKSNQTKISTKDPDGRSAAATQSPSAAVVERTQRQIKGQGARKMNVKVTRK